MPSYAIPAAIVVLALSAQFCLIGFWISWIEKGARSLLEFLGQVVYISTFLVVSVVAWLVFAKWVLS